jgi:hypothetical protein
VTNLSESQLARLPKAVRAEIERLDREVEWWKAKAEVGPEQSDTFADAFAPGEGKPLGRGTRVLFHHGPGERDHVTVHVREGEVSVSAYGSFLQVLPSSGNSIRVRSLDVLAERAARGRPS